MVYCVYLSETAVKLSKQTRRKEENVRESEMEFLYNRRWLAIEGRKNSFFFSYFCHRIIWKPFFFAVHIDINITHNKWKKEKLTGGKKNCVQILLHFETVNAFIFCVFHPSIYPHIPRSSSFPLLPCCIIPKTPI